MSLYNLLHGTNPFAGMLLAGLGTHPGAIPRFRDCYIEDGKIVIHTRTGGGNRDYYENLERRLDSYGVDEEGNDEGPWNDDLRDLPGFVSDDDDSFDSTYANFRFDPPSELAELVAMLDGQTPPPAEKWQKLFAELNSGEQTPAVKHAMEVGKPVLDAITKALGIEP